MKEKFKIWWLYVTVFITGAAVLVIEILGTRVLTPFYGSTIYVWSSLITITLGALALGYFAGGYLADRYPKTKWFYGIIFIAGLLTVLLVKINTPVLTWSNVFGFQWGPLAAASVLFSAPFFFFGTITPFAIRLRALSLEHTGHISGMIFGVSTVGSVIGAVLAGFYFIPNFFFSTVLIAIGIAVMTAGILGLIFGNENKKTFAVLFFLGIIALSVPAFGRGDENITVLYNKPSFYGDIKVVDKNSVRCLIIGSQGQSCINRISGETTFAYQAMIADFLSNQKRERALVIGFGGGILARDLLADFKAVDGVEIDPKILDAAKDFFGYNSAEPRLHVFVADGRMFLRSNNEKYDIIVLDAFSSVSPAPHLYSKEAFADMKSALREGGLLMVNTIGYPSGEKARLQRSLFKTLHTVFPEVMAMSTEGNREGLKTLGNIIFLASEEKINFPFRDEFLVRYAPEKIDDGILLSDARNPLEIIGLPVFEESRNFYLKFLNSAL